MKTDRRRHLLGWAFLPTVLLLLLPFAGCMRNGRIDMAGEVVDQDGRPLDGVEVGVNKARVVPRKAGDPVGVVPTERAVENHVVDGRFNFSFDNCAWVGVVFDKPGYYRHALYAQTREARVEHYGPLSPAVAALLAEPRHSNKATVRVVLERQHDPTELQYWTSIFLNCGTGESRTGGRVADFDKPSSWNTPSVKVADLGDPAQLPAAGAYILADTVDGVPGGPIDLFEVDLRHGGKRKSPRRLRLIVRGENAGLVRVPPVQGNVNVLRGMKQAPADGYQPELVMDEADLRAAWTGRFGSYPLYFYFRTGGRYGKGRLGLPSGGSDVQVHADFLLQPDGSRNLESNDETY